MPLIVALAIIGWTTGLLRPMLRALRSPAVLLVSIVVINALLFPGASERWLEFGPFAVTREGVTFGLVSAGRLLAVFLASVLFLFTTLADDLLEALVGRGVSHRLAFVLLSAVQLVPRLQARAGSDPRGPAGARPPGRGLDRPPPASARPAHRAGRPGVAGRRP